MAYVPFTRFVESNSLEVFRPRVIGNRFRHLDAIFDGLVSSVIQLRNKTSNLQEARVSLICPCVPGEKMFP
jgi:hypothetical protein